MKSRPLGTQAASVCEVGVFTSCPTDACLLFTRTVAAIVSGPCDPHFRACDRYAKKIDVPKTMCRGAADDPFST